MKKTQIVGAIAEDVGGYYIYNSALPYVDTRQSRAYSTKEEAQAELPEWEALWYENE